MSILLNTVDILSTNNIYETIVETIKNNQFFQGGAVIGILIAIGNSLKNIPIYLFNRLKRLVLFQVHIPENDTMYDYFENYLQNNYKKTYRNVELLSRIQLQEKNNEPLGPHDIRKITYKQFDDNFLLRFGLTYIKIEKSRIQLENASNLNNIFYNKFVLSGIFAKSKIDKLLEKVKIQAEIERELKNKKSVSIITSTSDGHWFIQDNIEVKDIKHVFIDNLTEIINDMENFTNNIDWYKKRSIMYKRGYGFWGPPGNGKTTLCLSLAKYFNRDIYFLGLSNLTDAKLIELFRNLEPNSMLIIEDIDAAFNERQTDNKKIGFTFSTLLNCLDGVFAKSNVITIFTSNHPELLDPALIRAGRIDFKCIINNPNKKTINNYLKLFYETNQNIPEDFLYFDNLPMVEIQNKCLENDNFTDAFLTISELSKNNKTN